GEGERPCRVVLLVVPRISDEEHAGQRSLVFALNHQRAGRRRIRNRLTVHVDRVFGGDDVIDGLRRRKSASVGRGGFGSRRWGSRYRVRRLGCGAPAPGRLRGALRGSTRGRGRGSTRLWGLG